ncbi:MAG: hypothetical protein ERJ67_00240 [Aphanocapsa feldmannii 277cV]|uniref:Uncharacterized protein n=2 Tax=Aphanocapsa feldmannii TaxID=192050 RepID=A0A524RR88_9CHRO|nr:MAG: hypothetical protein ERJ69_09850 [Aphanocapsa feldmannii 288cV]TGG96822.1 MAG: hypothetical protein ERJ67_00240 [Aphanocapsa feldmannii 277cV]TGH17925.1 MAG: hypothetical protein ERJ68_09520 [Aphanocapsa feldmannii 277cI]
MLRLLRRTFPNNRRDGSRMVSSAFAIACLGILVTVDGYPLVGMPIVVFAGSAAALWFSYYRGLKH